MKEILMPRFDPEMKSGRVVEWLKKEGDKVSKGEPIVRIDTEKVTIDVESPHDGILTKILVQRIADAPIGAKLGLIASERETAQVESTAKLSAVSQGPEKQISTSESVEERASEARTVHGPKEMFPRTSPSARRRATELGVDLAKLKGSGPGGRITSEDVDAYASSMSRELKPIRPASATPEGYTVKRLDVMRATIAERMVESWTKIPQVPLIAEVKLDEVEKFRASMEKFGSKKISSLAIITKSLANALFSFRDLNSRFEADGIHEYNDVDIAVAVAIDRGLITPVLRNANRKSVIDISGEIESLAERARLGRLDTSDVRGGTTTVSSLAGFGVDVFIPIINPPQATILGVGERHTSSNGNPVCAITLVFDHRVSDGARAAQLLQKIKDLIENPHLLQLG